METCCGSNNVAESLELLQAFLLDQIPQSLILHVLSFLPADAQAYAGKLVCKAPRDQLSAQRVIHARRPDLPLWVVRDYYENCITDVQRIQLMAARASQGDLAGVQWLTHNDCPWGEQVCDDAAEAGQLQVLQWLCAHDPPCPINGSALKLAAAAGRLQVLEWWHGQFPNCRDGISPAGEAAVAAGHLDAVRWLQEHGWLHFKDQLCSTAARAGQLHVLQFLRQHDHPWDEWTTRAAAAGAGNLELLQWMRAQQPPCPWWDCLMCPAAASGGHLHVLQWLRGLKSPCPWDDQTCLEATKEGHLHVLQWLRAQEPPCPWSKQACEHAAARAKYTEVLSWLQSMPQ